MLVQKTKTNKQTKIKQNKRVPFLFIYFFLVNLSDIYLDVIAQGITENIMKIGRLGVEIFQVEKTLQKQFEILVEECKTYQNRLKWLFRLYFEDPFSRPNSLPEYNILGEFIYHFIFINHNNIQTSKPFYCVCVCVCGGGCGCGCVCVCVLGGDYIGYPHPGQIFGDIPFFLIYNSDWVKAGPRRGIIIWTKYATVYFLITPPK